ncbi:hypothetical protein [Yeosuana marina]|uniref:hypothetical protein n=1 Tax=Yeosuana marina TaxID=1565536 RepID=UPI0030C88535
MKHCFIYYYVQSQEDNHIPEIVYHTKNKKTNEYYYKFLYKEKAKKLAEEQKKLFPVLKFRVIECIEIFELSEWF